MTRATILLATALCLAGTAQAARKDKDVEDELPPIAVDYRNPILFADYSDPDVIRVGNDYYLVASSFHFSPGIPVLHSRDLVHWTIIGHVLPRLPFGPLYDMPGPSALTDKTTKPTDGTRYAGGVWAPSIRHHDGRFYVYWATPDEGVFMSSATDPAGPWSDPVTVIYGAGFEDPCPFWDDDGKAWLVRGQVGAGPLYLHRLSDDGTHVLDGGIVIAEDREKLPVLEGPKLYKRNGWYYIFAPIGGVPTGPQAVGRGPSPWGPFEWRQVLLPGNGLAGPHQGGYVETPGGQGWFVHFQSTGAFGRVVHLQPVRWEQGWPIIGDAPAGSTAGLPVLSAPVPETGVIGADRLQDSDSFDGPALGLQWSWNHNPVDSAWSLTERPGWLRLHALSANQIVTARNTLTQILQGPGSTITTRMDISEMKNGQRAGLSLFGAQPAWIGVAREGGAARITLSVAGEETQGAVLGLGTVELRAQVAPDQTVRYSWRTNAGTPWEPMDEAIPLAKFSWWKGSRPALFSFTHGSAGGVVDFDWVQVSVDSSAP